MFRKPEWERIASAPAGDVPDAEGQTSVGKAVCCFALAGALVLAGCGSSSSPASSAGAGGGASSSSGGGGGGAGGDGAGGSGGAATVNCDTASFSIDGDGPTNHYNAACMGSYGATYTSHADGYLAYASPTSPDVVLDVEGCAEGMASPMDGSLSLTIPQTGVGSATTGKASYANGVDTFTTDSAVTATITELTSATIQGSYMATLISTNNGTKILSGTFSVCRVPNYRPQ